MKTPTVDADQVFPHTAHATAMQDSTAVEAGDGLIHFVDLADGKHTLCGLALAQVLTGGYCEHLDGRTDAPQFERAIFARDGRQAESCETCLNRQPVMLAVSTVE